MTTAFLQSGINPLRNHLVKVRPVFLMKQVGFNQDQIKKLTQVTDEKYQSLLFDEEIRRLAHYHSIYVKYAPAQVKDMGSSGYSFDDLLQIESECADFTDRLSTLGNESVDDGEKEKFLAMSQLFATLQLQLAQNAKISTLESWDDIHDAYTTLELTRAC